MRDFDGFERRLVEAAGGLFPSEAVEAVVPFRFAVRYIIAGMALLAVRPNFLYLQYILPMVGEVLLYLGFRTLRRENSWFMSCYVLAAAGLAGTLAYTVLLATPLSAALGMRRPWGWAATVLTLVEYFCFWRAERAVWRKLGQKPKRDPLLWALIWCAAMGVMALLPMDGMLALGMLLWLILILLALWRAGKDLEEVGYALRPAPVRVSRRLMGWGTLALTLAAVLALSFWSGRPAMDWQPRTDTAADQTGLCQELLELGFPERVLEDLSPEDLAGFDGTVEVYCAGGYSDVSGSGGPEMLTVCAVTSRSSIRVLHWFRWGETPGPQGQDVITASMPFDMAAGTAYQYEGLSGRLLLRENGTEYTCGMEDLHWEMREAQGMFGFGAAPTLSGHFTLPASGTDLCGYVVYDCRRNPGGVLADQLNFRYYRRRTLMRYPWAAPETALGGGAYTQYHNFLVLYLPAGAVD